MSSSIVSAPSRAATSSRSSERAGTSRRTIFAPSRCRVVAIASPMPREAPVTSATLPSSGRFQSGIGHRGDRLADPDHLARDVGGLGREQEAQRRVELVLGALGDVDQLHGDAAADLLAERAGEALQRPLRGRRARRQAGWRGAEHDDAAGPFHPLHVGMEEALQLDQLGRVGDPGGVEDERLDGLLGIAGGRGADLVEQASPAPRRAARRAPPRAAPARRRPPPPARDAPAPSAAGARAGGRPAAPAES